MNISQYEKQGFEGVDVCLRTSLCEYGLIWKEYKYNLKSRGVLKGEILAIAYDQTTKQTDYGYFTKDDLLSTHWIKWRIIADYSGFNIADLKNQDTGFLLFHLIGYYGKENFGF